METVFEILNQIDVNEHTEKKGNLTYLSWAWAWQATKRHFPSANYTVYENDLGFNYHTDGLTAWVKVGVTINDIEHIEYLPVMDYKNKSIPKDQITSFNVNTAIQRALTKAIARHGLGLYIYAGEDLPEPPKPEKITEAQVNILMGLLSTAEDVDMDKFLQFAQSDSVENIIDSDNRYLKLKAMLEKKQPKDA